MTATAIPRRVDPVRSLREFGSSVATILTKELRSRFRGRRAFLVLTLYLAVLAMIAYGAYSVVGPEARDDAEFGGILGAVRAPNASARIGQAIFTVLSMFQLLLVCFIAPAFTAGAISLEREKQTLDLLVATPMRPGALVVGKLLSALAFVALMILAAIPVSAMVLMYGGASVDDILRQQVVLFASAIGFGVIGLFYSALTKRTQIATVLTYSTLIALTIGTLLVWRFWVAVGEGDPNNQFTGASAAPEMLLWVNPAVAMVEIVANTELDYGDFSDALTKLRRGTTNVTCEGGVCFPTVDPPPGGVSEPAVRRQPANAGMDMPAPKEAVEQVLALAVRPLPQTDEIVSNHFWTRFAATFAVISVGLTLVSMRLVVPAPLRFRRRRPHEAVESQP